MHYTDAQTILQTLDTQHIPSDDSCGSNLGTSRYHNVHSK